MPDYVFEPTEGSESRLKLAPRAEPWHVRVGEHDLYIEVDCSGRWVRGRGIEEMVRDTASKGSVPPLDDVIRIRPEGTLPDAY